MEGKSKKERGNEAVRQFRDSEITVLLSVDLISEGFDVPACDCVLLLRPTQSLGLHLQQVGRALRPSDQHAVILDAARNSERHGMPDDSRQWSLKGQLKALNDRLSIRGRELKELRKELAEAKEANRGALIGQITT